MTTDNPHEPAIEIRDLVTHYGERKVIDGLNLAIYPGEIMAIMGFSGSGKTTLFRQMLGLKKPTSGSIRILGKDINTLNSKDMYNVRRQIGVAFQGGALFSSLTVAENVELPLREHTKLNDKTIGIMSRLKLEVVNLAGCENLKPSELSGGMLKRVALARALIMDPRLLFFDEPSAGLDPIVSAELDELIIQLRNAMKMTIVVITHELHSAFKIADRITIIDKGEILITGTVDEVRHSPNPRVQNMLNRKPREERVDADAYMDRLTGAAP
ncbi:MAG: putative ABC transport system ATP-binding protein [Gammaproteobacteria bacterium]|nr:MAG: putative ABC transport system ATP-binding protein [Gammaproteobacteria bacterium]TND04403.1 MAG: putative ABC transport system ATP-binding protein [Gammaproteobacteria bacterium]